MASGTSSALSRNDSAVLGALFDPEASLQSVATIDNSLPTPYDSTILSEIKQQENLALSSINEDKPTLMAIEQAIQALTRIITTYRNYASAWNNRAQARRMLFDLTDFRSHASEIKAVYNDILTAIDLASPKNALGVVSASAAKVLASAHTHRGYLLWRASRPEAPEGMLDAVEELRSLSKERLEELASKDFALGGRYGNDVAQQLAVKTNPYAKLCGSIVREAIQKEIEEFSQQSIGV